MTVVKDGAGNVIGGAATLANGTFTATGNSTDVKASNTQLGIRLWGTFVGTVDFRKSYDGGTTWIIVKSYTAAADEIYEEIEQGVTFDLACSAFTSGTINYRLVARDYK